MKITHMNLQEALTVISHELENNPQYFEIVKAHIRTSYINSYEKAAINEPIDYLFCPRTTDLIEISDDAAESVIVTFINFINNHNE
jgi:hypothetical protein